MASQRSQQMARAVRRAYPIVLAAYERWQALSDEEKDRYKRQAREYAERGRKAYVQAKRRGPGRH